MVNSYDTLEQYFIPIEKTEQILYYKEGVYVPGAEINYQKRQKS